MKQSDILGTLANIAAKENINVTILSGDRDTFQLVNEKINVRIPHTKAGKTETEDYDENKIKEIYGLQPKKLIEVKGLMGDTSDNIPGVPGVGEKTAIKLVKEYGSIENLYEKVETGQDNLRGALRNKIIENKDLALLSKQLRNNRYKCTTEHANRRIKNTRVGQGKSIRKIYRT